MIGDMHDKSAQSQPYPELSPNLVKVPHEIYWLLASYKVEIRT